MRIKEQGGFTLIEVIVVAGIIAILAGILVPLIFKEIDESRISRAYADVRSISNSTIVFRKDTGQWPLMIGGCTSGITFTVGNGTVPTNLAAMGFDTSVQGFFDEHLSIDDTGCYGALWKGPYIARVNPDPWAHAYVMNSSSFGIANNPVWIISAGPNGVLDTNAGSSSVAGDDIGIRLK